MADIVATKLPNKVELAYGKVIVSTYDLDPPDPGDPVVRMVVRVLKPDNTIISDLRQLPNLSGYCHFDISNVLRTLVTSNKDLETSTKLTTGDSEVYEYKIAVGYQSPSGVVFINSIESGYYVVNGRKDRTVIDWDKSNYSAQVGVVVFQGISQLYSGNKYLALTDYPSTQVLGSAIPANERPSWVTTSLPVRTITRRYEDDYTLSFLNDRYLTDNPLYNTLPSWAKGLHGFYVAAFNGTTQLYSGVIENITVNGGGPDTAYNSNLDVTNGFKGITIQTGFNGVTFQYPTATHFYVAGFMYRLATTSNPPIDSDRVVVTTAYRFNIDNGECNDFDNVQVSWLNSFGFRDYFNFQKRLDKQVDVTKNTYQQLDADWSGTSIQVSSTNRGERVFGVTESTTYTVNTRYLTDEEAAFLENLFISPDIRVKLPNQEWEPVVAVSNSYIQKTFRKDRLFQYQFQFRIANPRIIQNG